MSGNSRVLVIGTADTKSDELLFLKERIEALGLKTVMMDVGVLTAGPLAVDVTNRDVAAAAGSSIEQAIATGSENDAMIIMAAGASKLARELFEAGEIGAMIALGGSMGTDLALDVAAALPLGVPKFIVSTIAFSSIIPTERLSPDLMMILWAGGLYGLNSVCKSVLSQAAGAVGGAMQAAIAPQKEKPVIGMSSLGKSCLPYMATLVPELEKRGYEVAVFHATGMGGRAIEALAAQRHFAAVLDLATSEVANERHGGALSAGPRRLETAGALGIPQIVAPGASDMIDIPAWQPVGDRFAGRDYHAHNRLIASVGQTAQERVETAKFIAGKLAKARGRTAFVLPSQGVEAWDRPGEPMHDPDAIAAYAQTFRETIPRSVEFVEIDAHICDAEFCNSVLEIFDRWVDEGAIPAGHP